VERYYTYIEIQEDIKGALKKEECFAPSYFVKQYIFHPLSLTSWREN